MNKPYQLNSWLVSPYSAKVRAYMTYKEIPFVDNAPNVLKLLRTIKKAVGRPIMPTVVTPEGEWWQDSSDIIDTFETLYPQHAVVPETPLQRIACYLLELHGDEWLVLSSLWYRWSLPENARFALGEFGANAMPIAPRFIQKVLAKKMAAPMQSYLPLLGLNEKTDKGIQAHTELVISTLQAHLAQTAFLFGGRASIADFALYGHLWAHLWRDPASRYLFNEAPDVVAWFDRLNQPAPDGEFLPDDQVAETLDPLFRALFAEQYAYIAKIIQSVDVYCDAHPDAKRVPRVLGKCTFEIGGAEGERKIVTYGYYMAQRAALVYQDCTAEEKQQIDAWLDKLGGKAFAENPIKHPFVRRDFKEYLSG